MDLKQTLEALQNNKDFLFIIDELVNSKWLIEKNAKKIIETQNCDVSIIIDKYIQIPYEGYTFKWWLIQLLTQLKNADNFIDEELTLILSKKDEDSFYHMRDELAFALVGIYKRSIENNSQKLLKKWWNYFKQYWDCFYETESFYKYNYYCLDTSTDHTQVIKLVEEYNNAAPFPWFDDIMSSLNNAQKDYNNLLDCYW